MLEASSSLPKHLIEIPTEYLKAKEQFFILTGVEPRYSEEVFTQTAHAKLIGPHLRFVFESKESNYDRTRVLLDLMNFEHAQMFKCLEPREGKPITEFYITIAPDQFKRLDSFFAPGATMQKALEPTRTIKSNPRSNMSSTTEILFDPNLLDAMKSRNKKKYPLEGISWYFAKLILNSASCFAHLAKGGLTFEPQIELEIESVTSKVTFAYDATKTSDSRVLPPIESSTKKASVKPQL